MIVHKNPKNPMDSCGNGPGNQTEPLHGVSDPSIPNMGKHGKDANGRMSRTTAPGSEHLGGVKKRKA